MTQELADAEEARESVFEFRTELRRRAAAVPEEGPPLRVYLEQEGRGVPRRLAWTAVDGAHSAIAFRSGTAEFAGVHRGADGIAVELRGTLAGRRAYPLLPPGVEPGDVLVFDTHEEVEEVEGQEAPDGDVWRSSGRIRLLVDDGRGCALRDLQWEDTRGVSAAVSFEPDRSGFLGYLARPGQEPLRYRGFAVPGRQVPEGEDLLQDLEQFGRQALGVVNDVVGRIAGWLGGGSGGSGGNSSGGGPRPA